MTPRGRIRVYMATSLDGYVAGPDDDLSWLPTSAPETDALTFDQFLADVGVMVMGRRTFDVVAAMGAWPYGDLEVWVVTSRPLDTEHAHVRAVSGDIPALLEQARLAAGGRDVYLDGGAVVRQAIDAGCVDELVLTVVPVLLGGGVSLFAGLAGRSDLVFVDQRRYGEMLQLTLVPGRQDGLR